MSEQNGPLPPSLHIWLPSADSFDIDAPNSDRLWYAWDRKQFARLGRQRLVYIRRRTLDEFPNDDAHDLPLWILVVRVFDWHVRIPVWLGPEFFVADLPNDAAVMMTIAECISRGLYDRAAIDERRDTPNA